MAFNYSGYAASHPKFGGFFSQPHRPKAAVRFRPGFPATKSRKGLLFYECFIASLRILRFYKAASGRRPNEELKPLGNG
jgi:hypothetical protein